MKNNHIILEKSDGIYDINPLSVPDLSGVEMFLILSLSAVFLTGIIYFIWYLFFSDKSKTKRQIKQLNITYNENKINTHDAIFKLCFLLQQGLKITHIGSAIDLPEKLHSHNQEWHHFAEKLSVLRYSNNEEHIKEINELFSKSLFWLRLWP